jgi:hypothetical protein
LYPKSKQYLVVNKILLLLFVLTKIQREKTSQAFRDASYGQYKSSCSSKTARRKHNRQNRVVGVVDVDASISPQLSPSKLSTASEIKPNVRSSCNVAHMIHVHNEQDLSKNQLKGTMHCPTSMHFVNAPMSSEAAASADNEGTLSNCLIDLTKAPLDTGGYHRRNSLEWDILSLFLPEDMSYLLSLDDPFEPTPIGFMDNEYESKN